MNMSLNMAVRWGIQIEKKAAPISIYIYHIYPTHIIYTLRWWFHLGSAYLHIAMNWCVSRWNGRDTMDVMIFFISRPGRLTREKV